MNWKKCSVLVVCLCCIIASQAFAAKQMPAFSLKNPVNGKQVESSSFAGKALLVVFFGTWCPPCIQEVPTLNKLQEKYERDDFSVVGISVDTGRDRVVKKFIKKQKTVYPVIIADAKVIRDFGGVYGIPVSFLINRKGHVVKRYQGYQPFSVLEKDLRQIL